MNKEKLDTLYFYLDCTKLIIGLLLVGYFTFIVKQPDNPLSIIGGSLFL
jgi:hypothetical protein